MEIRTHREDARGNVFTLTQSFLIRWRGKRLIVPAGFESDGASVPRFFWRVVFPPTDTRALRAAIAHDYIYRHHPPGWTRAEADRMFRDVLIADGVSRFRAGLAWLGVRLFGGSSWNSKINPREKDFSAKKRKGSKMKKHLWMWMLPAVIGLVLLVAGCSSLAEKAVAVASGGTVMKIETTGSTTSGSVAPNLLFGTIQNAVGTAPALAADKKTQVVVGYAEAHSALAALFGHKAVTRTFVYIGSPSESSADTRARMESLTKILTGNDIQAQTASTAGTATVSASTLTEGDSATLGKADSSTGE